MTGGADSARAHSGLALLLCETIARACNLEPAAVTLRTHVLDTGMDSLTLVSVLAQVEAVYELELASEDTLGLLEAATVAELVERLEGLVGAGRPVRADAPR